MPLRMVMIGAFAFVVTMVLSGTTGGSIELEYGLAGLVPAMLLSWWAHRSLDHDPARRDHRWSHRGLMAAGVSEIGPNENDPGSWGAPGPLTSATEAMIGLPSVEIRRSAACVSDAGQRKRRP